MVWKSIIAWKSFWQMTIRIVYNIEVHLCFVNFRFRLAAFLEDKKGEKQKSCFGLIDFHTFS